MKRPFKLIIIGFIMIIGSILSVFIVYDLIVFLPHSAEIQTLISDAPQPYKSPPVLLVKISTFVEGKEEIKAWVARSLLSHFNRDKQPISKWHMDYALWTFFLRFHFTDAEIFTLWCYFFPYGDGQGLHEAANFYYKRDLAQLNTKELITIVARMKAPSYYRNNPQKLDKRVKDLFEKYMSMHENER